MIVVICMITRSQTRPPTNHCNHHCDILNFSSWNSIIQLKNEHDKVTTWNIQFLRSFQLHVYWSKCVPTKQTGRLKPCSEEPRTDLIQGQANLVYIVLEHFTWSTEILLSDPKVGLPRVSFPSGFPTKFLEVIIISHAWYIYHSSLSNLIWFFYNSIRHHYRLILG